MFHSSSITRPYQRGFGSGEWRRGLLLNQTRGGATGQRINKGGVARDGEKEEWR